MKKILIAFAVIIVLVLSAAVAIPIIFKDDIKAEVDKALAESVNADIIWDTDDFSLSLFTNFPNVTAGLNNFGVINRAPFEGERLFAVETFAVEIDLFSLFGEQIKINGIELVTPEINIKVLEDGRANYDIAIATEETAPAPATEEATKFNIGIDHWQVTNGHVVYDDATLPFKMEIKGLDHSGSGDFNQDAFDLATLTEAGTVTMIYDGVEYLTDKNFRADIVMTISDNYGRYTFKENKLSLNDFALAFDGFIALNEDESIDMDLTYGAKEATFKSLLSLVPGIYTADFKDIQTSGTLSFDGGVKGKYSEEKMPAFNVALTVADAMFKYPDLPTAISNISMDLAVDNKDGVIDNTVVDLKQFHMDFGNNPIDAKLRIANLVDYDMVANVKGKLNLGELNTMFPMEGMAMKGIFSMDVDAKGTYDSVSGRTPTIDAKMTLTDGYIKTADLPYALENLKMDAVVLSPTGDMADFKAVVNDFSMVMDGEPFGAQLEFANLNNYTWNVKANGGIDLEKITKVFPLEGMTLAGIIKANLTTAGNMADLDAERYDKLPTSGNVSISNFKYEDAELPYGVTISSAKASFDPQKISLDSYNGTVGKSDMALSGAITNYIGYLFGENQTLKGTMSMTSNLLDLNEFMTEEEEATEEPAEEEAAYGVVEVPKNIDFVMNATINKVVVMDMDITNAKGKIIVRDGVVDLSDLSFKLLDGAFAMSGSYDPRDLEKPKYDFNFKVDNLSSSKAFETFSIVQSYFPIAKNVEGNLSTDFKINGLLDQEMMPDMATVSGAGLVNIAQAKLKNSKILKNIGSVASFSSLSDTDEVTLKDILMSVTIENGAVSVKPFDLQLAGFKSTVSGTNKLDGSIDYNLKMDVPANKLGSALASKLGASGTSNIPLSFGIGGTYDDPKAQLTGSSTKQMVTDVAKNVVKEQAVEKLGLENSDVDKEAQKKKILEEAQTQADRVVAEGKAAADRVRKEGYAQADNLVKEAGGNILKKKIAEEAAKKLRKETDEKAAKIEAEAKAKSDKIMEEARKKADGV